MVHQQLQYSGTNRHVFPIMRYLGLQTSSSASTPLCRLSLERLKQQCSQQQDQITTTKQEPVSTQSSYVLLPAPGHQRYCQWCQPGTRSTANNVALAATVALRDARHLQCIRCQGNAINARVSACTWSHSTIEARKLHCGTKLTA
jgi:hypothetical protein